MTPHQRQSGYTNHIWIVLFFLFCGLLPSLWAEERIITITADSPAVQLGKKVHLSIQLPESPPEGSQFVWTATAGTVSGDNGDYSYTPPDHPGRFFLRLSIRVGEEEWAHGFTAIQAYRQWVILKADDFATNTPEMYNRWATFLDYIVHTPGLKASAGVVGERTLNPSDTAVMAVQNWQNSGHIEFFCHGWDHSYLLPVTSEKNTPVFDQTAPLPPDDWSMKSEGAIYEFQGTSYESQLYHLQRSQQHMREVFGVTFRTFGAPFNSVDTYTSEALATLGEMDIWLFGLSHDGLFNIKRGGGEIESAPGVPDFLTFQTSYIPSREIVTLQLHPNHDPFVEKWSEFVAIIEALQQQGVTFILPAEYADLVQKQLLPVDPDALISDPAFEGAVRETLQCWTETIDPSLLATITHLTVEIPGMPLRTLAGIERLTHLESIEAQNNQLTSLYPVQSLPAEHPLKHLDLQGAAITTTDACKAVAELELAGRYADFGDVQCHCLRLTLSTTGQGKLIPPPGEYYLPYGSTITITAYPEKGWKTLLWQGGQNTSGTNQEITVLLTAHRSINVYFEELPPEPEEGEITPAEGEPPVTEGEGEGEGEKPSPEGEITTTEGEILPSEGESFSEGEITIPEGEIIPPSEGEENIEGEITAPEGEISSQEGEPEGENPTQEGEAPADNNGFTCRGHYYPEGSFMERWVAPVARWMGVVSFLGIYTQKVIYYP